MNNPCLLSGTGFWMRKRLLPVLFLLLIIGSPATHAQSTSEAPALFYSLDDCIEFALKNQLTIQNAIIDENIAEEQVRGFRGLGLPQISGSLSVTDQEIVPTVGVPQDQFVPGGDPNVVQNIKFGIQWSADASLTINQMLFDGSFFVGLEASRRLQDLQRVNTKRTKVETAYQVSTAYYTVMVAEKQMKLLDVNIEQVKDLLFNTNALNQEGFVEKIDVDRLRINYQNLLTEREKVENQVKTTKQLLKFQMGMDLDTDLYLTDTISDPDQIPPFQGAQAEGSFHNKRIEYQLLATRRDLQILNQRRFRVSRLPSLYLFAQGNYQAFRVNFDFFDTNQEWFPALVFGVSLNIPIWDGFQTSAQIQETGWNIKKIENEMRQFQQAVNLEVSTARISIENAYKTLETRKKTMELAEEILRVSRIKYEEGVGSNLEVINDESQLRQSQNQYLTALYEYYLANIDLEKAKGELLPANLGSNDNE